MKSLHKDEMDKARKLALSICIWRVSLNRFETTLSLQAIVGSIMKVMEKLVTGLSFP